MATIEDLKEKQLLEEFHLKAARCSNRQQMETFCGTFMQKHGNWSINQDTLVLPPKVVYSAPVEMFSTIRTVTKHEILNQSYSVSDYESIVKRDMLMDLAVSLYSSGVIKFVQEDDYLQNIVHFKATIKAVKQK